MTLSTLIEKLQTAEGPSRELDARIHALVYPDQMIMIDGGSVRFKTPATYAPIHTLDLSHWNDWEGLAGLFGVDRLTASIDAAVAFKDRMLPGWLDSIVNVGDGKFEGHVFEEDFPDGADFVAVNVGSNRAIALLIAVLKAMEERG